jgi:hypothetical protein
LRRNPAPFKNAIGARIVASLHPIEVRLNHAPAARKNK